MKKKTIATSLLAILVSTYAVPFVSNAEGTQATTQTTEVAEQSTTEQSTTEESTGTTESSEEVTENTDSSKEDTKEETPAQQTPKATKGVETKSNPLLRSDLDTAKLSANLQIEAFAKEKGLSEDYIKGYRNAVNNSQSEDEALAVVQQLKDDYANIGLVNSKSEKKAALTEANNKLEKPVSITDDINAIDTAKTVQEVTDAYNKGIKKVNEQATLEAELSAAQEKATKELNGYFVSGKLDAGRYNTWLGFVQNSPDAKTVEQHLENLRGELKVDAPATEPSATEPSATEPSATEPSATEPSATEPSATEPSATEPSVTEPSATEPSTSKEKTLEEAKADARAELLDLYSKGLLTTNEYLTFLGEVDAAKTNEEVAGVVAKAKELIESRKAAVVINANVTTKVEKVSTNKVATKAVNNDKQLPKTGETTANNLTALGLMSVALGSLAAAFKRKKS